MAKIKSEKKFRWSVQLNVSGDNAHLIKDGLDKKMKDDNRKTYNNTIEAALVEYFNQKK